MRWNAARQHIVALALVAAVAVIRLLLAPIASGRAIGSLFVLPITLAALYGGVGAALTATLASLVAYLIVAVPPIGSVKVTHPADLLQVVVLGTVGLCIAVLVGRVRESQKRSQAIINLTPFMMTRCGNDLRYEFVSHAYAKMLGRQADDIAGRPIVEIMGEKGFETIRPYVQQVLQGHVARYESAVDFAGVGSRELSVVYTPERNESNEVVGWVASIVDVTDRKAAEDALREADRRKDAFLAILAHELRNPLAPIRTGLELLRLGGDKPGTLDRIRPIIERQVTYMVRLIDDLLDVSRITSGKIHLQRQPTPLTEVVHNAIEANRAAFEAAGVNLLVTLPEVPCVLDVDPTRFVQVLSNVLHNASKFTDRGGDVRIHGEITHEGTSTLLALSIRDTGSGIAAATLPHVFDLFVQGQSHAQPKAGLGIGLALAKQLVEMQGGRIDAQSEGPGHGSTFTIRIPVQAWTAMAEDAVPHQTPHGINKRVLIIDDNVDAADTLAELVIALGGVAETANSGEAGLTLASTFGPDAVLLDIGMPHMDGYETCRRLRIALGRGVFIVALTGWGQPQDRERALREGFDAHLTKPADPQALAALLAEVTT